jgi:hypothetical protein
VCLSSDGPSVVLLFLGCDLGKAAMPNNQTILSIISPATP